MPLRAALFCVADVDTRQSFEKKQGLLLTLTGWVGGYGEKLQKLLEVILVQYSFFGFSNSSCSPPKH